MSQEEQFINQKFGKEQPFRVPEGYFDSFADQFMAQLPERETRVVALPIRSRWQSTRRWVAAACLTALVVGAGVWGFLRTPDAQPSSTPAMQMAVSSYNTEIDQAADYVMMENEDFYAYVSDY